MTELALYIHWPFCVSKCPYCDFNSHVRDNVDQNLWRDALLADLAYEASLLPDARLISIFFGGGTPSLMPPETVAALIEAAGQHWRMDDAVEITLEANPSSVEAARFGDLARAGVNRVSLGLQSLDDEALRFLGRAHDVAESLAALKTAQQAFTRVSFDLIYALPGQTEAAWSAELKSALAFGTDHLSLYQLTIEPGTRFATLAARGEIAEADPDYGAALYTATQDLTEAVGLPAYEISNHARPGEESRHNLAYWRYRPYAGIGPGAHGRRTAMATVRHKKPENWLMAVARNGHGLQAEERLASRDEAVEAVMMGLRLNEGIDRTALSQAVIDEANVDRLAALGLLHKQGSRIAATLPGRLVLNSLLAEIIADAPTLPA
ncbi:radical SAM family heme chaperone HemW [Parasphingopyxis marina]|uniref:Heme chaperone HemW n=1 Tax=Parasphingopyxis marina TaxID=2761622 RepID=A0A842HYM3_9SPHN|nr:radical SAM family heme chaperone HemW [Parasphingopyxis marina]MBC2778246.1 coproporphyrinogen III oxidase [Parasphingopyxis marina]